MCDIGVNKFLICDEMIFGNKDFSEGIEKCLLDKWPSSNDPIIWIFQRKNFNKSCTMWV